MEKVKALVDIWNHETEKLIPEGKTTEFQDEAAATSLVEAGVAEFVDISASKPKKVAAPVQPESSEVLK
ncbi:MAG: hypothetical protein RBJ76_13810 [Stenomitos frigidus ULC029]